MLSGVQFLKEKQIPKWNKKKQKLRTGLLHRIIYISCTRYTRRVSEKKQIIYSLKKGRYIYYFFFFYYVKFKVLCMNLRQNIGRYITASRWVFCISCVIWSRPNIRRFSDRGKRFKHSTWTPWWVKQFDMRDVHKLSYLYLFKTKQYFWLFKNTIVN